LAIAWLVRREANATSGSSNKGPLGGVEPCMVVEEERRKLSINSLAKLKRQTSRKAYQATSDSENSGKTPASSTI